MKSVQQQVMQDNRVDFKEGSEIWEVSKNGSEKLRAVYKKDENGILTFIQIK